MRYISLFIIIGFLYACAPVVSVSILRPANDPNVAVYKNVVVLPFIGNDNKDYSDKFVNVIKSADLDGTKVFNLVDSSEAVKVLNAEKTNPIVNLGDALKIGKELDVQAVWYGTVKNTYSEETSSKTIWDCNDRGDCSHYYVDCATKAATFEVFPKLLSIAEGKIVYDKESTNRAVATICSNDGQKISKKELENKVINEVLTQFGRDISPYKENMVIEFMDSKSGISDDEAKLLLSNGIKYAKKDKIDNACEDWKKALEISPESMSLIYNVALCAEMQNDYQKALELLTKIDAQKPKAMFLEKFWAYLWDSKTTPEVIKDTISRINQRIERLGTDSVK